MSLIPRVRLTLNRDEFRKVRDSFIRRRAVGGKEISEFENQFQTYLGGGSCVALHQGRCALWLALKVMPYTEGEVIIPAFTCSIVPDSVVAAGFTPVFVDVDPLTYNIDPDKIPQVIGSKTRAIIPVHLFGHAADMDPIVNIARDHNLIVIEDNASSLGGTYRGKKLGTIGDMAIFSFGLSGKNITTGTGGMLLFASQFAERIQCWLKDFERPALFEIVSVLSKLFGYHVFSRRRLYPLIFRYIPRQLEIERESPTLFNVLMSNVSAEIGLLQLGRLDTLNNMRRKNALYMYQCAQHISQFIPPVEMDYCRHVYTRFLMKIRTEGKHQLKRNDVVSRFLALGVDVGTPYRQFLPGLQRFQKFVKDGCDRFPVTQSLCETLVSIPVDPYISERELDTVGTAIQSFA